MTLRATRIAELRAELDMGEVKRLGLRSSNDRRRIADVLRVWADRVESGEVHGVLFGALRGDDRVASVIVEDFSEVGPVHLLGLAHSIGVIVGNDVLTRMDNAPTTD